MRAIWHWCLVHECAGCGTRRVRSYMIATAFTLPTKVAGTFASITIAILIAILRAASILACSTIEGSITSAGSLNAASTAIAVLRACFHIAGVTSPAMIAVAVAHGTDTAAIAIVNACPGLQWRHAVEQAGCTWTFRHLFTVLSAARLWCRRHRRRRSPEVAIDSGHNPSSYPFKV